MIFERFREAASQFGNELAIVDEDQRITYSQLLERVASTRGWLQRTLNPQPGSVIAASLTNTWQFVAAFFAVSELGAILAPCNPHWRAAELRWLAQRLAISGVVSEPQFRDAWDQAGDVVPPQSVVTVPGAGSAGTPATASRPRTGSASEPAVYLTTSGSTGVPRVVPRSHRNLAAGASNTGRSLGIGPGGRLLSVVPFHHANGFHNCMLMPLLRGAAIVLMPRFTAAACAELIHREKVNWINGSPAVYKFLAESPADPSQLSSLEFCFSAGARLPEALSKRWKELFGIRVRQWYGMAETSAISIDRAEEQTSEGGGYVGSPVAGVELRVLDAAGKALGYGAVGEIAVRSEAVMSGYFGEPDLNQRIFSGGFFMTGDSGSADAAGNLFLAGRIGRVINIGGVKIDPVEVERAIEALPGVSACQIDVVHSLNREVIRARVAVRSGFELARREVIEHCRERLAEYKLPRIIEFVDSLPITMSGKAPAAWKTDEPVG